MAPQVKVKPQRYSFESTCMTKDNQLAKATLTVKYLSSVKMDEWFLTRTKTALTRAIDAHVEDTFLYDVTTDRNPAKDLVKRLTDLVKTATKLDPKPTPTIKVEEVALVIKRER